MATRSDTFDRADTTSLGSDWAEDSGNWTITSNNVLNGTTGNSYRKLRWVGAAMDSDDYSVEVVARSASSSFGIGPAVRCVGSATVTYYAYIIFGGDAAYLVEITAGGETILDTGGAITAATNYTLRLEVDGSTIRGYLNGVLDVEATDASLASGAPGIAAYGGNSAGTYITTWTATDLATGTTYNQSVAGSLTPAGALSRSARKALAGALAPSGALARLTAKTVAGALAPVGALAKRTSKNLAGTVSLAGALAAIRTSLVAVGGSLALSGSLTRQTAKSVVGSIVPVGALARRVAKTLAGTIVPSGTLATQLIGGVILQAVGGTLAMSGALARSTSKLLAGTIVPSGTLAKLTRKFLGGVLGLAGQVGRTLFGPSAFLATVTLADDQAYTVVVSDGMAYTVGMTEAAPYGVTVGDEP